MSMAVLRAAGDGSLSVALSTDQWNLVVVAVLTVVFLLGAIVGERS